MSRPGVPVSTNPTGAHHPALAAWHRLGNTAPVTTPAGVETLKAREKSRVYRLTLPEGRVIAKACSRAEGEVERLVYTGVLPRLPLPTLQLYGSLLEGERAWLFLEDASGVSFDPLSFEHRALAGAWLADLHRHPPGAEVVARLPPRGPAHYRGVVASARETLRRGRANPVLSPDDAALLDTLVSYCDEVLARWPRLVAGWDGLPRGVVHGDFWAKNLRVGSVLLPFDWGGAGWGLPVADLAGVDLEHYGRARRGPLTAARLEHAAHSGALLRLLAALPGEEATLASPWPERALRKARFYEAEFERAARALGWR